MKGGHVHTEQSERVKQSLIGTPRDVYVLKPKDKPEPAPEPKAAS